MKRFAFFCILLFISAKIISVENRKILLNSNWKFILSDKPEYQKSEFNDADWRTLDLPHDWSIEGKPEKANPTSGAGGYFPAGTGWYRKHLNVPADWAGKRISLYFEGVYMNATVFVNGVESASHPYGYTSFQVDVTDKLTFGKENTVAVRVDNSQQLNCRWYSGSGIYRHVWLNITNPVHVDYWGVAVTTPEVSSEKATVLITTKVKNETAQSQKISLKTTLKGIPNAVNVQPETEIPAFSEAVFSQTIIVEQPALWSPEKPDLYQAMVEIKQGKTTLDKMTQSFGIRTIEYSSEKGFLLNGKQIKLNGGCVHHDHGCLGAASYDRAEERKVELLKAAGFNAVRTSHNPPAEAFLDACDRLGYFAYHFQGIIRICCWSHIGGCTHVYFRNCSGSQSRTLGFVQSVCHNFWYCAGLYFRFSADGFGR